MNVGIVLMPECKELTPQVLGRSVEDLGFESVFYPEHTHIPVNTRRGDGGSARDYANTYDPFVALAAVAAVTSTLKLGLAQTRSATTSAGTGRRQRSRHRRSGAGLRRRVAPAGGLLRYSRR
ncbi:MAG TPA: LLM class flavin-dependent oxidoreductase, partial [Jatrophihabitantaceae bacterium]